MEPKGGSHEPSPTRGDHGKPTNDARGPVRGPTQRIRGRAGPVRAHCVPFQPDSSQLDSTDPRTARLLAQLSAPRVGIHETQKYSFALVLRHQGQLEALLRARVPSATATTAAIREYTARVSEQVQVKVLRRLVQAGLGVILLDNVVYKNELLEEDSRFETKNLVVLINPKRDPKLLVHEFKREMDELAIRSGEPLARMSALDSLDEVESVAFAPALEMQLTYHIIQNALKEYNQDEWAAQDKLQLEARDAVLQCFPLHDRVLNHKLFAETRRRAAKVDWCRFDAGNMDRWVVEELRLHFGERVAFLFAFMHVYTKFLLPVTVLCVVYYLSMRFLSDAVWREYMQGLAVIGYLVACAWGPAFLISWERETRLLNEKWDLDKYKTSIFEENDNNPNFQFVWERNELTKEMEKVPVTRHTYAIRLTMLVFVFMSAIVQCFCLLPFIQWYVFAKHAPVCAACEAKPESDHLISCTWFLTCFHSESSGLGTDRWLYILIQGIALGLVIDIVFFELFNWVSLKFVAWENYARLSEHENRLIHRRFVFVWTNWFFWFLFLAFVYLPFGDRLLGFFKMIGLGSLAPYDWDPSVLTLDTLFVTPLVVTQFLNMLLETILPYLVKRIRGRPLSCRKASSLAWCFSRARELCAHWTRGQHTAQSVQSVNASDLARSFEQATGQTVQVRGFSDDSNAYSAYEIIAESNLPVFDPVLDYLDACIQFSYVVMFSVVWPLLPFPAFVNNVLEMRGDLFRLLFGHRRPMPRRDDTIGEWTTVLAYANVIGITVVAAFIVIYHAGYFVATCDFSFNDGEMVPFVAVDRKKFPECEDLNDQPDWRMNQAILFILLEHLGFCLRYLMLQVEKIPSSLRDSGYQRLREIEMLTSTRSAGTEQFEYIEEMRDVFDRFDEDADDHLLESELMGFLSEWLSRPLAELQLKSGMIFRYMDKTRIGRIPFSTCCLLLQHVHHDRFLSSLLGLYDLNHDSFHDRIQNARGGIALRRAMSRMASIIDLSNTHDSAGAQKKCMNERSTSSERQIAYAISGGRRLESDMLEPRIE